MLPRLKTCDGFRDCRGAIAPTLAVVLPLLMLLVLGGVDYALSTSQRAQLQRSVDAAALSAAKELGLSGIHKDNVPSVVQTLVINGLKSRRHVHKPRITTNVSDDPLQVEVVARQEASSAVSRLLGLARGDIEVRAVARIVGQANVCVLALEESEPGAIWMVKQSRMTGDNCAVFSNSSSSDGLAVRDGAVLKANTVCSAGGIDLGGTISPGGVTDCPQFEDPLALRAEPAIGPCEFNKTVIDSKDVTLHPGVYCGGLTIKGTSNVILEEGTYIIKDGLLWLGDQASLTGDGVSFFLGTLSVMFFGPDTSISLQGSKTGPLAGLLIFGSRSQPKLLTHTILSKKAQTLVGTIYLPRNSFIVDGDASVGGASAYTAIVARRLVLLNGPDLVLHSNYDQTDVPVPKGLRGAAQPAVLAR